MPCNSPNPNGSFDLCKGFSGYVDIEDPLHRGIVLPLLQTVPYMFVDMIDRVPMPSASDVSTLGNDLGTSVDVASSALVMLVANDCTNTPAPDVSFQLSPPYDSEPVHYLRGTTLDKLATTTDATGTAFAILRGPFNPSFVQYTMWLTTTPMRKVGSGTLPLRLGAVSREVARPEPSSQ
jgi:hypothetical protein